MWLINELYPPTCLFKLSNISFIWMNSGSYWGRIVDILTSTRNPSFAWREDELVQLKNIFFLL
jgi:hypothetical protein